MQFDEEGGEGGTSNVDRELDLILSAQARASIAEIDRALDKIDGGTYGSCEQCGQPIPEARLEALPARRHVRGVQERRARRRAADRGAVRRPARFPAAAGVGRPRRWRWRLWSSRSTR